MKKTGSRLTALLAALALTAGLALPCLAAGTDTADWVSPYADVGPDNWFYEAVAYVSQREMMNGVTADRFRPGTVTNRAMIVTILWRLDNQPDAATAVSFTDVTEDKYYAEAVAWGGSYNIVTGYEDGTFRPGAPITREQLAAILYRYALSKGYDVTIFTGTALDDFPDGGAVSSYAHEAMRWAVSVGIVGGKSDGTLSPKGSATRAEAAAMLMRFCEKVYY